MRGSIVKRGKTYSVVVELDRDPVTQKRRQKWHGGFRTQKEAESELAELAELAELVGTVNRGTYVPKSKQTVGEFVTEWLAAMKPTVRPATAYSYGRNLKLHVTPYIGSMALSAVDACTLNGLYAKLLAEGRKDYAGGGLSPRSVHYVHTIIHRLLRDAMKWGRLARNVADAVDPPRSTTSGTPEMVTWTPEQLRTFLAGVAADRLSAAYVLLGTTGMRRGEALGLRWSDVDLDQGRASIRQTLINIKHDIQFSTPKTAKGRRTVMLDDGTVAALREHRKRQNEERLQIGSGWKNLDLSFCRVDGTPLHPERFTRSFAQHVHRLGLPRIRLHDLRHGWATMALGAGIHPKVVR